MKNLLIALVILGMSACSKQQNEADKKKLNDIEINKIEPAMSASDSAKYFELGDEVMSRTKQTISTALVDAMEKGGVKYAAQFCNVAAYPILDSISKVTGTTIRRVSNKARNPKDKMNEEELKVYNIYSELKSKQVEAVLEPILIQSHRDTITFYAPIKISMPTCLKCHGEVGKDIKQQDYTELKQLYPNDEAIGYKEGDLRGVFSIQFVQTHESNIKPNTN